MKLLFTFLAVCFSAFAFAQNKIVITYDQNGNRVKRELICPGCRPAPPQDSSNDLSERGLAAKMQPEAGKQSLLADNFKVFPNPARNQVSLQLDALSLKENCRILLSGVSGKTFYHQTVTQAATLIPLDGLADGVYFLTLLRGSRKDVIRIVKESGL